MKSQPKEKLNYGHLHRVPAKAREAPVLNEIRAHNASRYFLDLAAFWYGRQAAFVNILIC